MPVDADGDLVLGDARELGHDEETVVVLSDIAGDVGAMDLVALGRSLPSHRIQVAEDVVA